MLRGVAAALAIVLLTALACAPAASARAARPSKHPKATKQQRATSRAAAAKQRRSNAHAALASIVEDVTHTTAHRYGALDDQGEPLDGLKVIQVGGTYVGVYHTPGGGRFNVEVATSTDLIDWTRRATLDEDAAQPTIAAVPSGGLIVAYEKTSILDLLPRPPLPSGLASALDILDGPLDRIRIRFRYYRSLDALLAGQFSRQFTASRTLSPTAEGTPSITSATLRRGLISRSRIEVKLHYFADLNGDGTPDLDRTATGVLTDFDSWQARATPDVDNAFLNLKTFHEGYTAPPRGSIGDRDDIVVDGVRMELQEAQYVPGDYSSWRIFLLDPDNPAPQPLDIVTNGGSHSFGNPTATALIDPAGKPAVFVTLYAFAEGAAPGEAGPLEYYDER